MIEKIRNWLLVKLAAGKPIILNVHFVRGIYIDADKSYGGFYCNVHVNNIKESLPDGVGFYFHSKKEPEQYFQ